MQKFHSLTIKSIQKTTADCSLIEFEVPEQLQAVFSFIQGQYLTLKATINGEELRRSYSLCSAPIEKEWKVGIKQIEDGRFSTFANQQLKVGDELEVMPPSGRFYTTIDKNQQKNYVAFAAGSGITPIISIIKTHLALEPKSTFKLFYVNQSASTIILKEELEGLKNKYFNRFEIFHFLTRQERSVPLFNGRIDKEKLSTIFKNLVDKDLIDDYFMCGPHAMIFLAQEFLQELGVAKKHIHFELFNTDGIVTKRKKKTVKVDAELQSEINIIEGGKNFKFSVPRGSENILDAALMQSADLPYACKGGVCCTCKAKLLEGEVDMIVNYGLEKEEIEGGYILTCQAIPTSEKVVVDFDSAIG